MPKIDNYNYEISDLGLFNAITECAPYITNTKKGLPITDEERDNRINNAVHRYARKYSVDYKIVREHVNKIKELKVTSKPIEVDAKALEPVKQTIPPLPVPRWHPAYKAEQIFQNETLFKAQPTENPDKPELKELTNRMKTSNITIPSDAKAYFLGLISSLADPLTNAILNKSQFSVNLTYTINSPKYLQPFQQALDQQVRNVLAKKNENCSIQIKFELEN